MLLRQDQRQRQFISQRIDPKLILANAILQRTAAELNQEIEAELLDNPALEIVEDTPACQGDCIDPASCPFCSQRAAHSNQRDLREVFDTEREFYSDSAVEFDDDYDPLGNLEAEVTLQDHLRTLLRGAVPAEDLYIGEYLINSLSENGWLDSSVETIAAEIDVSEEDVDRILAVIQSFDPPGIGARDLHECLLIQLRFLRDEGRPNSIAERMVRDHFDTMVRGLYGKIGRALGVHVEKVQKSAEFIRTQLHPYPASRFRSPWVHKPSSTKSVVRPDVLIRRNEFGYDIEVVGESYALAVNPTYREAYNELNKYNGHPHDDEKKHFRDYVERAELFIRNIQQRRKTLRTITRCIIDCQQGFLETGSRAYLRPLTRTRIGEILELHESTVSRATSNKYVQLPNQEVIPFDLFFNPSLSVKKAIEDIIAAENPAIPLSDQQISDMLQEQGIRVARRTVVKYRESQKLLSSARRRR